MKIKKIMIAAIASIASIIAILFAAVEIVYFLCLLVSLTLCCKFMNFIVEGWLMAK